MGWRGAAVAEAVGRVGEALVGSAMTTICGLGMMYFADFGKFRNSGPAIALCLAVTLLACLTLAPALLRATGRAVFWPLGLHVQPLSGDGRNEPDDAGQFGGFWRWAAGAIIRRPGLILIASVALLAPIAYQGLSVRLTYDLLNELDRARPSVLGANMARRHFAAGEMAPITVLALKKDAHFESPDREREIARLTKRLYSVEGVEIVRSIAAPTGDPPGYFQPFRSSGLKKLAARKHKMTKATLCDTGARARRATWPASTWCWIAIRSRRRRWPCSTGWTITCRDCATTRNRPGTRRNSSSPARPRGFAIWPRSRAAIRRLIQRLVVLGVLTVLIVLLRKPGDLPVPDRLGAVQLPRHDRRDRADSSPGSMATPSRGSTGRCRSFCS